MLLRFFSFSLLFLPAALLAEPLKIVPRADWNALEARPYAEQKPERFTIHHSGVRFEKDQDAAKHIANVQKWGMSEARNWSDIPYHFIIGPDGTVFEGRDPKTEGESNTSYDTNGHLQINLLGNFNEQEPTDAQLESLTKLIAWAHEKFDIPIDTIKAHRDFAQTACPGDALYHDVENGSIRKRAQAAIDKARAIKK